MPDRGQQAQSLLGVRDLGRGQFLAIAIAKPLGAGGRREGDEQDEDEGDREKPHRTGPIQFARCHCALPCSGSKGRQTEERGQAGEKSALGFDFRAGRL